LSSVRLAHNQEQVRPFLNEFCQWAARQPDILGVALLGSYARNEATSTSDVDLVIVATELNIYLKDTKWARYFGAVDRQQIENYGKVSSLRVWYSSGCEVEYGFTDETWCRLPLDEGTRKVIAGGMQVLIERGSIFKRLKPTSGDLK
jgi:predicted nucleotidyltransferase